MSGQCFKAVALTQALTNIRPTRVTALTATAIDPITVSLTSEAVDSVVSSVSPTSSTISSSAAVEQESGGAT